MRGLMMDRPLMISQIIEYAAASYPEQEIVSRTPEGGLHRYNYEDAAKRSRQLANALKSLGVQAGDRIATVAWNTYRHLELYYAVSGIGAICHTINPRLPVEQFGYIVNHAKDQYIFLDLTFVPLLEKLQGLFEGVKGYVVMTDRAHMPETSLPNVMCYEELVGEQSDEMAWPEFDEHTASSLCYTSGTTGNPKGVLYSHRSTLLHAFSVLTIPGMNLGEESAVLPVVPMFHVNAWGLPYMAPLAGASLIMPGPALDGDSLFRLMDEESVDSAWGVPTVWLGLLAEMKRHGRKPGALKRVSIGGSAAPRSMVRAFEQDYQVDVMQGWGMTEMNPTGTMSTLTEGQAELPLEERIELKTTQGRQLFGVRMKLVDEDGHEVPQDGEAVGELLVKGPTVIRAYFNNDEASAKAFDKDGWFATGDMAKLTPDGVLYIVDRAKDLIKSGGEWISSIDLENLAAAHPDVQECAVIGVPHPKWDERPLLIVVPHADAARDKQALLDHMAGSIAKWQLPDDVIYVDELPHTATGKVSKRHLREDYMDYLGNAQ